MQYITNSKEETVELGIRLAKTLVPGDFIAFTGGMGAGKTAFCTGIAQGLSCIDKAGSPTFAIVNYYRGEKPFAHFDIYRASSLNDLQTAGLFDYLESGVIVAAEWSENVAEGLIEPNIKIDIRHSGENKRSITIEGAAL
ncbi:MAG: tRNA (adenosine(37)-N6)-threonylcarbamoyltransferase complex ATPase subunit type 1 TsaE [Oscillospiraceae bacterium]